MCLCVRFDPPSPQNEQERSNQNMDARVKCGLAAVAEERGAVAEERGAVAEERGAVAEERGRP
jgi:hypothetical protein